ncbi:hypothetical protein B0H14DRAFT_3506837 [Mycena olivaceomarginata]|nr:hypothetical protein B0H14DRAFT_3506837 [Mycena olivaceomarginata]
MTALTYNQVLDRYFYLTGVVLLIYDHLLTLESEVRYIWTTDHTRSLAWYLLVRYFALCTNVTILALAFVDFSVKELMIGTTLILRVLAMFSFDKRVVASLASAAIIVICLFIRTAFHQMLGSFGSQGRGKEYLPRTFSVLALPYTEATPVFMMRPSCPEGLYGAF